MTPNNPPESDRQQQIVTIVDKNNVIHKVIPVNHTHSQSEVSGITTALASKMDAKTIDSEPANNSDHLVSSKGVYDALQNKADINSPASSITNGDGASVNFSQNGDIILTPKSGRDVAFVFNGSATAVSPSNAGNLARALQTPDSTPTENSDNLVTSGGVKAALDGKQNMLTFDSTPTANSNNPVTSGGVKAALDGKPSVYDTEVVFMEEEETPFIYLPDYFTHGEKQKTFIMDYKGASTPFADIFYAQNTDIIRILSHDDEIINITECFLSFRVIRQANGIAQGSDAYYVIFDGKNEY